MDVELIVIRSGRSNRWAHVPSGELGMRSRLNDCGSVGVCVCEGGPTIEKLMTLIS